MKTLALMAGFNTILMMIRNSGLFFGPPCRFWGRKCM